MNKDILELEGQLFKAVMRYIAAANPETLAKIVNEVLMLNHMIVFDRATRTMKDVESISLNDDAIQINVEEWDE